MPTPHEPGAHGAASLLLALLLVASPAQPGAARDPAEMNGSELRAAIAIEQARLLELLTAPAAEGDAPIHSSAELREIAARLPALQRRLREHESAAGGRAE